MVYSTSTVCLATKPSKILNFQVDLSVSVVLIVAKYIEKIVVLNNCSYKCMRFSIEKITFMLCVAAF